MAQDRSGRDALENAHFCMREGLSSQFLVPCHEEHKAQVHACFEPLCL